MRVLVVDDEPLARRRLLRMLARIAGVEVVGEAGDGLEAAVKIGALAPDVVLLDIHMPGLGGDGISLARQLSGRPAVIFTTAHSEHAVEAFDASATDYLLKPVELDRLKRALDRAAAPVAAAAEPQKLAALLERLAGADDVPRVTARSNDTVQIFDARTIARFHVEDKYTLFASEGREYLSEESLNHLEERLARFGFLRVHRSELVRLAAIRTVQFDGDSATLELVDGQSARVSRRSVGELKQRLGIP
jgi:DNA-binding LytR/AlgR family response regulator